MHTETMERWREEGWEGPELIALALLELAGSIRYAAHEIGKEGAPGMGAIEFLASEVHDGASMLCAAITEIEERSR